MGKRRDRVEYGLRFKWNETLECWENSDTKKRRMVRVFPPMSGGKTWHIGVPSTGAKTNFAGEAEAFSVAEVHSRKA